MSWPHCLKAKKCCGFSCCKHLDGEGGQMQAEGNHAPLWKTQALDCSLALSFGQKNRIIRTVEFQILKIRININAKGKI